MPTRPLRAGSAVPVDRRADARQPLEAVLLSADVDLFRLHLTPENKAARTLAAYTKPARWFAAGLLLRETDKTRWDQVNRQDTTQDVQYWIVWPIDHYSSAYSSMQFRALQQFFKWLAAVVAAKDGIPDPMAGLRPQLPRRPCPPHLPRIMEDNP